MRERRLMKGFQIGMVEDLIGSVIGGTEGKVVDVFGKLAKAMGSKSKVKKKDTWNAIAASKQSLKRSQIGTRESGLKRSSQRSLRRSVVESERAAILAMDSNELVEYNPRLKEYTPATRVAYAKFKARTLTKEKPDATVKITTETAKPGAAKPGAAAAAKPAAPAAAAKPAAPAAAAKPAAPAAAAKPAAPAAAAKPAAPAAAAKPAAPGAAAAAPAPAAGAAKPAPPAAGAKPAPAATAAAAPAAAGAAAAAPAKKEPAQRRPASPRMAPRPQAPKEGWF